VAPDWVLFSMGWMNRYGFPAASVLERVTETGAQGLDTASGGAIDLFIGSDGEIQSIRRFRRTSQRLWRLLPTPEQVTLARE
jgi:competence protein ComEC